MEGWANPSAGLDSCGKYRPHRDSNPGPSSSSRVTIPTELKVCVRYSRHDYPCGTELARKGLPMGAPLAQQNASGVATRYPASSAVRTGGRVLSSCSQNTSHNSRGRYQTVRCFRRSAYQSEAQLAPLRGLQSAGTRQHVGG